MSERREGSAPMLEKNYVNDGDGDDGAILLHRIAVKLRSSITVVTS
mgnify:CR=1 FL=1